MLSFCKLFDQQNWTKFRIFLVNIEEFGDFFDCWCVFTVKTALIHPRIRRHPKNGRQNKQWNLPCGMCQKESLCEDLRQTRRMFKRRYSIFSELFFWTLWQTFRWTFQFCFSMWYFCMFLRHLHNAFLRQLNV